MVARGIPAGNVLGNRNPEVLGKNSGTRPVSTDRRLGSPAKAVNQFVSLFSTALANLGTDCLRSFRLLRLEENDGSLPTWTVHGMVEGRPRRFIDKL